jgi:hypothetical protein
MTGGEEDQKSKKGGIPIGQWSGSNATIGLHETIKRFTAKSDEQTAKLINLTRAIVALTVGAAAQPPTRQTEAGRTYSIVCGTVYRRGTWQERLSPKQENAVRNRSRNT